MNEMQPVDNNAITERKIIEYLEAFGILQNLTDNEKKQCVNIAKEFNLNPFKREIHFIKYSKDGKVSIVVGYDVFVKRAERIGRLDGWRAWIEGTGEDMVAKIEIMRKDWKNPFYHEVYLTEWQQQSPVWKKSPRFMLKKVVIGQGFRLCFPDELGGLPYLQEEAEAIEQDQPPAKKADSIVVPDEIKKLGDEFRTYLKKAVEVDKTIKGPEAKKIQAEFMSIILKEDYEGAKTYVSAYIKPESQPETIDAESEEIDDMAGEIFGPGPEPEQMDIF